jgi:hypothetical protein
MKMNVDNRNSFDENSFFLFKQMWLNKYLNIRMKLSTPLQCASERFFIGITGTHVALIKLEIGTSMLGWHRTSDYVSWLHADASFDGVIVYLAWTAS